MVKTPDSLDLAVLWMTGFDVGCVIVAFGTTAPAGSVTVPVMLANVVCEFPIFTKVTNNTRANERPWTGT